MNYKNYKIYIFSSTFLIYSFVYIVRVTWVYCKTFIDKDLKFSNFEFGLSNMLFTLGVSFTKLFIGNISNYYHVSNILSVSLMASSFCFITISIISFNQ